jgi:long-chain acyl-CoA synthetase
VTTPTLAGLVRRHAVERPDHPYLHFEGQTVTYRELDERTSRVAAALTAAGVQAGDRVALVDKNSPVALEVMFGAAKCNAVYMPVNWRLAPAEIAAIIDDAEARVVVVGEEFAPLLDKLAGVSSIVVTGPEFEDWVGRHQPDDPGIDASPDDVALQMSTSGTTGLPKGVQLTNESLLGHMADSARLWAYDADSVNLVAMPLFHIGGTGTALLGMVMGGTTVLLREVDPAQIMKMIGTYRVTNTLLVPAVIQFLLDGPGSGDVDWSTLRTLMYGASPISETLLRRAMEVMDCDFVQLYGITECSGCVSWLPPDMHDPVNRPELLRSCGRPLPWVEVSIVDPESGTPVPTGTVGEIWARSTQNMLGYWRKPDATRSALTDDRWFRTGDAGYLDAEGFLYLHDRIKDMIVSGGENVYPAEVEHVLMRHPAVADVAVIGVPHDRWGETPKAVIVVKDGAAPTSEEIIGFCRSHLAGFKCPTSVDFVPSLPRNPAGKLLKRELREPYWYDQVRRVS